MTVTLGRSLSRHLLGAVALALSALAGAQAPEPPAAPEPEAWSFSASLYGYYEPDGILGQPTITADRGAFHAEARYNYEDVDTASLWVGYNVAFGEDVTFELTPLFGVVFGETAGVAPGYKLDVAYGILGLYSEGEYLIEEDSGESYFYTWNELTVSPLEWLRAGLVVQRTRAFQTELDIQRGILVAFTWEGATLGFHLFNPDEDDPTPVVSLAVSF
jgi:hypothetical protein